MTIKGVLERLAWMFKVRDCRHVCLWCEYFDICKGFETAADKLKKGGKENEHEIRA